MRGRWWLALVCVVLLASARADDQEALRVRFAAALAQARAGVEPSAADASDLRAYPLYPYLQATRWLKRLPAPDGARDAEIAAFVAEQSALPVTAELRRQWLLDLARREQWTMLLAQLPAAPADPALACARWQARVAQLPADDAAAARALSAELLAFWRAAAPMSASCNGPFNWLSAQGAIGDDDREQRARKALLAGNAAFAGELIAELPAARAAPLNQWRSLLDEPARMLKALLADPAAAPSPAAVQAAFEKLTRSDLDGAAALLAPLQARVPAPSAAELARSLALALAWNRDPRAIDAFRALPASALDDPRTVEWRIRAALWNRAWPQAEQWLAQLPPAAASDPRWMYWRARSAEQLGRGEQAQALYQALARDNGYYSLLAAERLKQPYRPRWRQLAEDFDIQTRLLRQSGLIRARELFYLGEIAWANAEWKAATQTYSDAERVQAARLAARWGWHWQTVLTLNQLAPEADGGAALDLLYPRAYTAEIDRAAMQAQLPPTWIYGVMRQESLFLPQAVSSSDALGLLQLKLATARDVARRLGLPKPQREDLFLPQLNVQLGSAYLKQITDRFGGQFVLTICSYNAGPNAVARWLPAQPTDADVWIENVPYNETRNYVQRIVWHIAVHSWQQDGQAQDVAALLQPVHAPLPATP